jgi:TolB-like protein
VLPFANLSGDPEQEYFVDGVTESLTTDLSRISGSFVIGRHTAFTYKGKAVDLKQVGRELNVRYVLEGSVQRSGKRLRVNVQLVDAENASHLWADRFDKPIAELFDMQDEIVASLANMLGAELIAAEARRAEVSAHPDAMDLYFQGWAFLNKSINPEHNAKARDFFGRALLLDPRCIEALVGSALADLGSASSALTNDRTERIKAAETAATRALSLAPNHARAHSTLGLIYMWSNRVLQGIAECERALVLDRNLTFAHGNIGMAKYFIGRGAETEAHVSEALRLSPRDYLAYLWVQFVGTSKLWCGLDAEAVTWYRWSIETNRNHPLTYFLLAAALAHLGELDEARVAGQAGLALHPIFTIRLFRSYYACNHPAYLAGRERTYQGMRMAGVPEG